MGVILWRACISFYQNIYLAITYSGRNSSSCMACWYVSAKVKEPSCMHKMNKMSKKERAKNEVKGGKINSYMHFQKESHAWHYRSNENFFFIPLFLKWRFSLRWLFCAFLNSYYYCVLSFKYRAGTDIWTYFDWKKERIIDRNASYHYKQLPDRNSSTEHWREIHFVPSYLNENYYFKHVQHFFIRFA